MKSTQKQESLSQEVKRLRMELQLLAEKAQLALEAADADIYWDAMAYGHETRRKSSSAQDLEQFQHACEDLQAAIQSAQDQLHQRQKIVCAHNVIVYD